MRRKALLTGSSLLALALAATAAGAADDVAVDGAAPAAAPAEEKAEDAPKPRGFYAVGAIGGSFFEGPGRSSKIWNPGTGDNDFDGRNDGAFTPDSIGEENNFMWGIYGGYRLADWLGVEVGYTDLGGFQAQDLTDAGNTSPHQDDSNTQVTGVEARLRAWIPLGLDRLHGIGGVGMFIYDSRTGKQCNGVDTSGCDLVGNYPPTARKAPVLDPREDSGQAFTISAGLQFEVIENVLIRTEYQHFFEVLNQGVDMVTLSVVVGFYDFFGQGGGGGDDFGGVTVE